MIKKFFVVLISCIAIPTYASIVVTGTRFIYPSENKEISINIENTGEKTALSQIWLTTGFSEKRVDKETTRADIEDVPFIVLPPLFKIKPSNVQTVRVLHTGEALARDRETIFTLNILDIPPKSKEVENNLQISVLSKFKFFYRPVEIEKQASMAIDKIEWIIKKQSDGIYLFAKNNSGFYITLNKAKIIIQEKEYLVSPNFYMMEPFSGTTSSKVEQLNTLPNQKLEIQFSYINDSGGSTNSQKIIN
ncbi:fimbrial biogenesis chaperone [Proteus hauseri]|uniref:fimbrial biogenesis chaperone n=1 Tax=Proteus hauseri TaxID=183417 RepID=UPI0032DA9293